MPDPIVIDIETTNTFRDVGAHDPTLLEASLVGMYDYATRQYATFLKEELEKLWPYIEKASCIVGYNSEYFDIPILNKYYPGDLQKIHSQDLLVIIKEKLGISMKLADIARATLGYGKIGDGLIAIQYYKDGNIDALREYCLADVKITKEIFDHGIKHKHIRYVTPAGEQNLKVDFTPKIQERKINFTLPI